MGGCGISTLAGVRTGEAIQGDDAGPAVNPWWVGVALMLGAVVALAAVGNAAGVGGVLAGMVETSGAAALAVGVYLAAAYGVGTLGDRAWGASVNRHAYRLGVGVALMLSVGHGLGALGWLTAASAIGVAVVGLGLAGRVVVAGARRGAVRLGEGRWVWIAAVPIAVIVVACASPPGWLWDSEYGAFDALAYHLELPQEWMRAGRVWPTDHNVYSYLPGYVESAYVQLAQMTVAPADEGLLAGSGWRAQMAHVLAAGLTLASAWFIGRVVLELASRAGADGARARAAAWGAGALALATPWVVVVGTVAYNEAGVSALGAAAVLAALDREIRPAWRGALAGVLVGVACGCKPTAMVFVTPVVGVVLLAGTERRAWAPAIAWACTAGALAISPWMVRNWIACGNPVFPQLAGVFGDGHWTGEQVTRFAGAHHYHGGVLERLRLLVADDPSAGAGAHLVERFRGAANPQWGLLFPAGVLALVSGACSPRARRWAWVLGAGLGVQLVVWMTMTHLQSRFLVPCVLVACPLVGVALAAGRGVGVPGRAAIAVVVIQTMVLVGVFATQRHGLPNGKTAVGLGFDLSRPYDEDYARALPWAWVNGNLDAGVKVYVLGDAAVFLYDRAVVSNSTWDAWALAEAMRAHPGDPGAWTGELRASGIDAVLISTGELGRLRASGWIDPELTPERVRAWIATLDAPVMVWEDVGAALFVLDGAGDE